MTFTCTNCEDEWWVCENHPDKAWADDLQHDHEPEKVCNCGAGAPCKTCNDPVTKWGHQKPGAVVLCAAPGWRF